MRAAIFQEEQDYESFLQTLRPSLSKGALAGHAYCLMRNHFHFVIGNGPRPRWSSA